MTTDASEDVMQVCGKPFGRRMLTWGHPDYWVGVLAYWNPWGEIVCPHRHEDEAAARACAQAQAARRDPPTESSQP